MAPRALALEKLLQDALDRRDVSIHTHRQIQIGKRLAVAEQCNWQLQRVRIILRIRIRHVHQAHFGQRIDRDDLRSLILRLLQRRQHPRMVRARIVPKDKDQLRALHVLQRRRSFAYAEGLHHRHPGGFMAHIRAIRHVVGAEFAHE